MNRVSVCLRLTRVAVGVCAFVFFITLVRLVFFMDIPDGNGAIVDTGMIKSSAHDDGRDVFELYDEYKDRDSYEEDDANTKTTSSSSPPMGVRGVILMLTREGKMEEVYGTIKSFEERFNNQFKYPYLILNDEEFSEKFQTRVRQATKNEITFLKIDSKYWEVPHHINERKMKEGMDLIHSLDESIPYWNSVSYRQMCRFYSGPVFQIPELEKYDWYWRLDDDVTYLCNVEFDPFVYLERRAMVYGFSIVAREFLQTVRSLMPTVLEFADEWGKKVQEEVMEKGRKQRVHGEAASSSTTGVKKEDEDGGKEKKGWMKFFTKDYRQNGEFNGCHFWNNMEIGNLNFFRSEAYQSYFDYLDAKGGFFYERWGDAPVRSLGLAILAEKEQVHYFHDIYYAHSIMYRMPANEDPTAFDNRVSMKFVSPPPPHPAVARKGFSERSTLSGKCEMPSFMEKQPQEYINVGLEENWHLVCNERFRKFESDESYEVVSDYPQDTNRQRVLQRMQGRHPNPFLRAALVHYNGYNNVIIGRHSSQYQYQHQQKQNHIQPREEVIEAFLKAQKERLKKNTGKISSSYATLRSKPISQVQQGIPGHKVSRSVHVWGRN